MVIYFTIAGAIVGGLYGLVISLKQKKQQEENQNHNHHNDNNYFE